MEAGQQGQKIRPSEIILPSGISCPFCPPSIKYFPPVDLSVSPQSLSELAAAFLQAIIALGVAVACAVLYERTRKPWFGWWTLAWVLYAVRLAAIILFLGTTDRIWLFWHQVLTGWVGLGLLWAALVFSRGTTLRGRWYLWALFPPVWAYLAIYQLENFLLAAGPAVLFVSSATAWTAWVFYRYSRHTGSGAARFLAGALVLWAVHHLDYPFLRARGAWDPWGYYLDILFMLATSAGILLLVIEDQWQGLRVLSAMTGALQRRGVEREVVDGLLSRLVEFPAVRGAAYWDEASNEMLRAHGTMSGLEGKHPETALADLLGRAARAEQPTIAQGRGYLAALPVLTEDGVTGALLIAGEARDPFAALDLAFLSALGRQVAAALENATLDRQLRQRTEELERLAQRMLRLHEDERRRLSRELHDETAQFLSALKLELGVMREATGARGAVGAVEAAGLDRALALVDTGIRSIRNVTQALRPSLLDDLGLLPALRALVRDFRQSDGLEVTLDAPQSVPDLTDEAEVAIFRAVQEGLANVVRHAGARTAWVVVRVGSGSLVMRVSDDGSGLRATMEERMGLSGMRERVMALGGTVTVGAGAEGGVTLEVTIPI